MAHESFEDEHTAELMNRLYINIKVDREERPDVDSIYMSALAMMGQQGGWPLTVFLTPEGTPYWGGTYFPPFSKYGHPGFCDVLNAISDLYQKQRDKVEANGIAILDGLSQQARLPNMPTATSQTLQGINAAAEEALFMIDYKNGGTKGAPKFPQPAFQEYLWRAFLRTNNKKFFDAVTRSITHMCQGGIYDHLGGGFARYSTDTIWLVPHFEKMLYDNAQLIFLMTLVWQKTHTPLFELRIQESICWAISELQTAEGGFAGSLDADSKDKHGSSQEGAFYVWDESEVADALGNNAGLFNEVYDVSSDGNWGGKTILNRLKSIHLADKKTEDELLTCRNILLKARNNRPRPGLDNKILADWNGLMIAALCYAGTVFEKSEWINAAKRAFGFIQNNMVDGPRLKHAYCSGSVKNADVLDDYAGMIKGALFLFLAVGEQKYLAQAVAWAKTADEYFWDSGGAGYFDSPNDATDLIAPSRTVFDNATPSGNGVMSENLARLYYLTGNPAYREKAYLLINAFLSKTPGQDANMPSIIAGFEILDAGIQVIVIAEKNRGHALVRSALSAGNPNLILLRLLPETALPASHPGFDKSQVNNQPTAYVCRGQSCGLPHTDPVELFKALCY